MINATVSAIQLHAGDRILENLAKAEQLIADAVREGAKLVVLPELFHRHVPGHLLRKGAESITNGPSVSALKDIAQHHSITIIGGSISELVPHSDKIANTSVVILPDGTVAGQYRKIHLFDIDYADKVAVRESDYMIAGSDVTVIDTPVGRVGLAICYDLRFPWLFGRLADLGAELIAIPSAFTRATGQDHWKVLLQARAIENQTYVVAANQHGKPEGMVQLHGHSMIIDPWGRILAEATGDSDGIVCASISADNLDEVRKRLSRRHFPPRMTQ